MEDREERYSAAMMTISELFAEIEWDSSTEGTFKRMVLRAQIGAAPNEEIRAVLLDKFTRTYR